MAASLNTLQLCLLAAGGSRRLGQAKALVELFGMSLLRVKCLQFLELKASLKARIDLNINVILGADSDILASHIVDLPIHIIKNSYWEKGQASSVNVALALAGEQQSDLMICLLDQWQLEVKHYFNLINAWKASNQPITCAYAATQDLLMAPMVCEASFLNLFEGLDGDRGAASILRKHRNLITALPMAEANIDLDTPDDLRCMQAHSTILSEG